MTIFKQKRLSKESRKPITKEGYRSEDNASDTDSSSESTITTTTDNDTSGN